MFHNVKETRYFLKNRHKSIFQKGVKRMNFLLLSWHHKLFMKLSIHKFLQNYKSYKGSSCQLCQSQSKSVYNIRTINSFILSRPFTYPQNFSFSPSFLFHFAHISIHHTRIPADILCHWWRIISQSSIQSNICMFSLIFIQSIFYWNWLIYYF